MRDVELTEAICDRFMALVEATGMQKQAFARSVGLTPQQLTNIKKYRNPPSHFALAEAARIYGVPVDYFYTGSIAGIRDDRLLVNLRGAAHQSFA